MSRPLRSAEASSFSGLAAPSASPPGPRSADSARIVRREGAAPLALFAPIHYEAGYAYPLVVWLHGARRTEQQLRRIMPYVSLRNYVGAAPRGTLGLAEPDWRAAPGARSPKTGFSWRQTGDQIALAEQRVAGAIESARDRFHLHPSRIFLAGHGAGGTMALRLALLHPERFAGVLALGGGVPSVLRPLCKLNEVRSLPIFLATGVNSREYPVEQVCRDLRLFHAAGMTVTLRQYPAADEIEPGMLADMNRWIMEQICPTQSLATQA